MYNTRETTLVGQELPEYTCILVEPLLEVGCRQLQPLEQVELLLNLLFATDQAARMTGIHLKI